MGFTGYCLLQWKPFTNLYIKVLLNCFWTRSGKSLLKEKWLCETTVISSIDYVECFKYELTRVSEIDQDNLKQNQAKMK